MRHRGPVTVTTRDCHAFMTAVTSLQDFENKRRLSNTQSAFKEIVRML